MRNEQYDLEPGLALMTFEFVSERPQGLIKKRVLFEQTPKKNLYNLAFGDINPETNDIDDLAITNNDDRDKVLATVAATVYIFTTAYPDAIIYAAGSNPVRTRLYRIGISNNLEELQEQFYVFGLSERIGWVSYEKNTNYLAFFIKRKNLEKNGTNS